MTLRSSLQAIYEKHGYLTPELVVEEARPVGHPLHGSVFDRPPKDAAEAWYKQRAHELIQSVRVSYRTEPGGKTRSVRAWHALRAEDARQYVYEPIERVVKDDAALQILLRDMEREWRTLRARYSDFEEFAAMVRRDLAAV